MSIHLPSNLSCPLGDHDALPDTAEAVGLSTDIASDVPADVVTETSIELSEIYEHLAGLFY